MRSHTVTSNDRSRWISLASRQDEGHCFLGVLLIRRGDVAKGVQVLRSTLEEFSESIFALRHTALFGDLAEALGIAREIAQGLKIIDEALERSNRNEERWLMYRGVVAARLKPNLLGDHDALNDALYQAELFRLIREMN